MINLGISMSREILQTRLRSAKPKALKDLASSFSKVYKIPVNREQTNAELRNTLEGLYFRDKSLIHEASFDEDKINGFDYFDFKSLFNCPFTTQNGHFDKYMAIIYHTKIDEPVERDKVYNALKEYMEYIGQEFSKRPIYIMTQWSGNHQVNDKEIINSDKKTITFSPIKEWKDGKAIL